MKEHYQVQCPNGHFYEPDQYSTCPHCPVGIPPVPQRTGGLGSSSSPIPPTAPPGNLNWSLNQTGVQQGNRTLSGDDAIKGRPPIHQRTMAMPMKRLKIDPVVGWLVCIAGPERGRSFELWAGRNTIGRSESATVCISSDEAISRDNHAALVYSEKTLTFSVVPGEGRNLTFLNNGDVLIPTQLKAYDVIELGQTKLSFVPFCGTQFQWEEEKGDKS